jgi:PIN domain
MKVLLDSDILLDVALAREPHVKASAEVLRWAESGGDSAVAWHSLTNCAYLLKASGRDFLGSLLEIVTVAAVGDADARRAIGLPMHDIEDAFQSASALAWGADFIITRNLTDYRNSPVPALTPTAFLEKMNH